jgi:prepilin-type N-terminal cleavage/methylation domain-containing protein
MQFFKRPSWRTNRPQTQRGFSLLEQLAALSLAGTVSAGAMTTLATLDNQAREAALDRLAASAATAMALNQAACVLSGQRALPGRCQPVRDCADIHLLLTNDLPAGFTVPAQPLSAQGARCTLQRRSDGASAGFHGVAAGLAGS